MNIYNGDLKLKIKMIHSDCSCENYSSQSWGLLFRSEVEADRSSLKKSYSRM